MKKIKTILIGLVLCAGITGCTSILNTPQGKILSVTERGIGFKVETASQTTGTPNVEFGFFSSTVVVIPTASNSVAPAFANGFDFAQSGALSLGINETVASGNYQTYAPNATNSAVTSQPKQ
jgi:hypothetical protein